MSVILQIGPRAAERAARVEALPGEVERRVICAASGAEALAIAAVQAIDVAIVDRDLADMPGLEAIERLRSDPKHGHLAVILLSPPGPAPAVPLDAYLVEPVFEDELRVAVSCCLRRLAPESQAGRVPGGSRSSPGDSTTSSGADRSFGRIAQSNLIGVAEFERNGRFRSANDAFLNALGYTQADIAEGCLTWPRITPPEFREVDARAIAEVAWRGSCHPVEREFLRRDGTRLPALLALASIGEEGCLAGIMVDLSYRRQVEQDLRDEERRQRFLATLGESMIQVADPVEVLRLVAGGLREHLEVDLCLFGEVDPERDRLAVVCGQQAGVPQLPDSYTLSGFSPETAANMRNGRTTVNRDAATDPRTRGYFETYRRFGLQAYVVVPLLRDGRLMLMMIVASSTPRCWTQAEIDLVETVAHRAFLRYETARLTLETTQALAALRESESRQRRITESGMIAVLFWDLDGRVIEANDTFLALIGYEREDLEQGRINWRALTPAEWEADDARALAELEEKGNTRAFEKEFWRQDGTRVSVLVTSAIFESDSRHGITLVQDITERRRAQQELVKANMALRRSNEDLHQFAYAISHDLQEPLRTITSYAQLLANRLRDRLGGEDQQVVAFLVDAGKRMSAMISDLLAFSRLDRDEGLVSRVSLDGVLQFVLSNLSQAIQESSAVVTHSSLPAVEADFARLSQVLQNLIGNSIKYRGGRSPVIEVTAEEVGAEVVVAVRDNGIGIDPAYQKRIFGVFKRLHGREIPGTGIGLSVCQKIIERYGGRIWVESQPGQGATFFFTVPRWQGQGQQASAAEGTGSA